MNNRELYLPNGLPVSGFKFEQLSGYWPLTALKSDPGSLFVFIAICFGLFVLSLALVYTFKAFIKNKIFQKLVMLIFTLTALASLAIGYIGVSAWTKDTRIDDTQMGIAVAKADDYFQANGLHVDNRTAWDLTCRYYDDANAHCNKGTQVAVKYNGKQYKVILQKADKGNVQLIDYETLLPVFESENK